MGPGFWFNLSPHGCWNVVGKDSPVSPFIKEGRGGWNPPPSFLATVSGQEKFRFCRRSNPKFLEKFDFHFFHFLNIFEVLLFVGNRCAMCWGKHIFFECCAPEDCFSLFLKPATECHGGGGWTGPPSTTAPPEGGLGPPPPASIPQVPIHPCSNPHSKTMLDRRETGLR